eukprot:2717567-Pyramimonas_sp.AAC.1
MGERCEVPRQNRPAGGLRTCPGRTAGRSNHARRDCGKRRWRDAYASNKSVHRKGAMSQAKPGARGSGLPCEGSELPKDGP